MNSMISEDILEKIMSDNEDVGVVTMDEIDHEAQLLGISRLDVIQLLFDFLIEHRFTSMDH